MTQPYWIETLGDEFARTPLPHAWRVLGHRTLLDAGVDIAGSSDYPVASYDVLAALATAITRRTRSGQILHPGEALRFEEALRAYTLGAATALGVEHETGSLQPGKRADLVVLSGDPRSVAPQHLPDLRVTHLRGRRPGFRRADASAPAPPSPPVDT